MELTFSLNEIENSAKQFIAYLKDKKVVAFSGNLGAGKTTFIKELCNQLGVKDNVTSPTFSIINQYTTVNNSTIFHIDLYRVKDEEEAINAGVEESIYSGDVCFIEWPEKLISLLPEDTVKVFMEAVNESKRKLVCKSPL
jgi:tRNA threonylcarbamoyladenosine biosynthesis protein TsaE